MSTSIIKSSLLAYKNQTERLMDKLCLLVIGTVAYGLAVAHPFFWEDWNVFMQGEGLWSGVFVFGARGLGRIFGNFLTYSLQWNPFGLVQLGQLIGITCLSGFIWNTLRVEKLWVRAILSSLFLFGFPYFVHGIAFPAIGNNHGVSTLNFIWFLSIIARRHHRARWIDQVQVAVLVAVLALAYEPWLLFLTGMALVAIAVKFTPGLLSRLQIYKLSNWQIVSIVLPIGGCLLMRTFSLEGQIRYPKLVTPSALFALCVVTARIAANIFVDSMPIGAIIGFGVMRSNNKFPFSNLGLWPYFLFGSIFATITVNFAYWMLQNGGVMDWRTRYVIMLQLTAFYFSLPWGTIGVWVQKHTGVVPNRWIGFMASLLSMKLVYSIWLTFVVTPVDRWGWLQYRSRIIARDPSVMQDFTDFGQCDNKYCFSFSGPGFAHSPISQYWVGGTAARLIPWLPIEGFY